MWSAHLSMLFAEHPLLERPAAARRAGFSTVESWWPPDGQAEAWAGEVRRQGLSVASLNSYCGSIEAGERGFLNVPELRREVLADFERAAELVRSVGAARINVIVGRARPGASRAAELRTAVSALRECATIAEAASMTILIEPLNEKDVPGYLVPDAEAASSLIEAVGSSSLRLLYDAYHAAKSGRDPVREVRSFAGLIAHVQYADCPGRGAPGTGENDLWAFVESLDKAGYDGAIGLEYDPRGATLESLAFLREAPQEAPFPRPA